MTPPDDKTTSAEILPFSATDTNSGGVPGLQLSASPEPRHKRRAFILEDVESNARMMAGFLDQNDYDDVRWVKSIRECRASIEFLKTGYFDLILMDVMLGDGVAFDLIKELAGGRCGSWVCAFTARSRKDELQQLLEAGCDLVFLKPLRLCGFPGGPGHAGRTRIQAAGTERG